MPLFHEPLPASDLSPEVQRIFSAPPAARMMAARGMVPITNPRDLIIALYQLTLEPDEKIRQAAQKSAAEVPEKILRAALTDATTPALVLDFFANTLGDRPELEAIVLNSNTSEVTIADLAGRVSQSLVDIISANEQRLLQFPDIIAAMYSNRNARMSTVDRAVELAIRNKVQVTGIPIWEELCKVYGNASPAEKQETQGEMVEVSDEVKDDIFQHVLNTNTAKKEGDPATSEDDNKKIWQLPVPIKLRLALLGNAFDRAALVRDPKRIVAMATIKSPAVTEIEAAKYAGNNALNEEVLTYIANKREWTRLYQIKYALVTNAKCPIGVSMRLLPHLRDKDKQNVARSKGIPAALATQAKKLIAAKNQAGGG